MRGTNLVFGIALCRGLGVIRSQTQELRQEPNFSAKEIKLDDLLSEAPLEFSETDAKNLLLHLYTLEPLSERTGKISQRINAVLTGLTP